MKWAATLAMAAAAACLASVHGACSGSFVDVGDPATGVSVCMYFFPAKASWHSMRQMCKDLNPSADLAKLTGDLHQRVIAHITADEGLKYDGFWIGGTSEDQQGSWKWIKDNTDIPLGTPHWYPCRGHEQPNNEKTQRYLSLYTPDYYFHNLEEYRMIRGICQIF